MTFTKNHIIESASRVRKYARNTSEPCAVFIGPKGLKLALLDTYKYRFNVNSGYPLLGFYDQKVATSMIADDLAHEGVKITAKDCL